MEFIHYFGCDIVKSLGSYDPDLLGNKGANLSHLADRGFKVPSGFILSSQLCKYYYDNDRTLPNDFDKQLRKAISVLEAQNGKIFGDDKSPLLLSVRSGAKESMPGMMDTILNVGINRGICDALSKSTNFLFAQDTYKRFLHIYGSLALKIPSSKFSDCKKDNLQDTIKSFEELVSADSIGCDHRDVFGQLKKSIVAVLDSWTFEKAVTYRKLYNIPENHGTAVIVQTMVFGNMNDHSGTGVVFSRNPINGSKKIYGEFLLNAQGEDIVSGTGHPHAIDDESNPHSMINKMPELYSELKVLAAKLEKHYKEVQDIEFTIENNQLYILQTRNAKRTTAASIKIAVDFVHEGLISKEQALLRVDPASLSHLMHSSVNYDLEPQIIGNGLAASPGAASGIVAFTAEEAEAINKRGGNSILVRIDTSPEDIRGMHFANGILTSKGGYTSHAAVIARGMGKPCVSGANFEINLDAKTIKIQDTVLDANSYITIDGSTGNIILGQVDLSFEQFSPEFEEFMKWADSTRKVKVRANAESALDISYALKFGAEGVGLARSEHMLFEPERLKLIRKIILVSAPEERSSYIRDLFKLHKKDFKEIFSLLNGVSVNVRLFDPPLHEFISIDDAKHIAEALEMDLEYVITKIKSISEKNPMLGNRGVRLGMTYPELYEMQAEAIFEALVEVRRAKNVNIHLEVMVPFISNENEVVEVSNLIRKIALRVQSSYGQLIQYRLGIMIELPRAALIADKLAKHVDYFSFGTNDLTQTVYGISRDDFDSFSIVYKDLGIFENPFISIDEEGVGEIMRIACEKARVVKPALSFSVCGEHAADPKSINFLSSLDLNYISCSPFRVLIARLASAQALIRNNYGA